MLNRRIFLGALAALLSPLPLQAQEKARIDCSGTWVSGEILNYWHSYVGKSLEGWLVCNGAEVDRAVYRELFTPTRFTCRTRQRNDYVQFADIAVGG